MNYAAVTRVYLAAPLTWAAKMNGRARMRLSAIHLRNKRRPIVWKIAATERLAIDTLSLNLNSNLQARSPSQWEIWLNELAILQQKLTAYIFAIRIIYRT